MEPGTLIDGKYEIVRTIGVGGFGAVYEAVHAKLNRRVALKVLNTAVLQEADGPARFEREAKAINALKHKNIVGFYGFGVWQQAPYMVMEYVEGKSLQDIINTSQKLEPKRALNIFRQMLEALSCAHAAGVIHRDLKPSNVVITTDASGVEHVKIIDFGLARLMPGYGLPAQKLTETGMMIGTCHYMAPEQALGQQVDQRADIYGAGCILYHMLAGVPPFDADAAIAVVYMHLGEQPAPLRDQSQAMQTLIKNCMVKSAEQRYQNCAETIADVDAILKGKLNDVRPLTDVDAVLIKNPTANKRKNPLPRVAAIACAALLLPCAVLAWNNFWHRQADFDDGGIKYEVALRAAKQRDIAVGGAFAFEEQMKMFKNRFTMGGDRLDKRLRHSIAAELFARVRSNLANWSNIKDASEVAHEYYMTLDPSTAADDFKGWEKESIFYERQALQTLATLYELQHDKIETEAWKLRACKDVADYILATRTPKEHEDEWLFQKELHAAKYLEVAIGLRDKLPNGRKVFSDKALRDDLRRFSDVAHYPLTLHPLCEKLMPIRATLSRDLQDTICWTIIMRDMPEGRNQANAEKLLRDIVEHSHSLAYLPNSIASLTSLDIRHRRIAEAKALLAKYPAGSFPKESFYDANYYGNLAQVAMVECNSHLAAELATKADETYRKEIMSQFKNPKASYATWWGRLIRITALADAGNFVQANALYEEYKQNRSKSAMHSILETQTEEALARAKSKV